MTGNDKSRKVGLGLFTVATGILVAASVAYACTVTVASTQGNMVITPNNNSGAADGNPNGTDLTVTGECYAGANGCKNATTQTPQTGSLYYALCGLPTATHCGAVAVDQPVDDPGDVHTFHNTICDGTTGTNPDRGPLANHSGTGGTNEVEMSPSDVPNVNRVTGEAAMADGLDPGTYVVCAVLPGAGGNSYEFLYNFFTYL